MYPQTVLNPTTALTYKFQVTDRRLPTQYRFENRTPYVAYIAVGRYDQPVQVVANKPFTCMGLNTIGFKLSPAAQGNTQTITVWLSNQTIAATFPDSIETFISLITLDDTESIFESPSSGLLSSINPATLDSPAGYPITYTPSVSDADTPALDLQGWNGAYIGLQSDSGNNLYGAFFSIELWVSEDGVSWYQARNYTGNTTTLVFPRMARYLKIRRKGNSHALTIRVRRYQNDPGIAETPNPVFSGSYPTNIGDYIWIFGFPKGSYRLWCYLPYASKLTFSSGFGPGATLILTAGVWGYVDVTSSYDGLHRIDATLVFSGALVFVAVPIEPDNFRPFSAAPAVLGRYVYAHYAPGVNNQTFDFSALPGFEFDIAILNGEVANNVTLAAIAAQNYPVEIPGDPPNAAAYAYPPLYTFPGAAYVSLTKRLLMMRLGTGANKVTVSKSNSGASTHVQAVARDPYSPVWTTQG